jgi:hypothetical protein
MVATSQGTPAVPASLPAGAAGALPESLALLPPPEPPEEATEEGIPPAAGVLADAAVVEELAPDGYAGSTPVELGAATAPEAMMTCGSAPEPPHAQIAVVISANGIQVGDFPLVER